MKFVNININGRPFQTESNRTLLEAATENGITIPTLCYHKKLSPIGSCRLCVVEVDGVDAPVAACSLPVSEGMSVQTESETLTRIRQMMIQLILVQHPLDCVICERSGECSLQNITYQFGVIHQPYQAAPQKRTIRTDWKEIRYNPNLCILCGRCIHICAKEEGESFLKISNNGFETVIDTVSGDPLDCTFCGACVSACPVGALSNQHGLAGRSWETNKVQAICTECSVGCSIFFDVKKNRILRVKENDAGVNQGSLCRKGRYSFIVKESKKVHTPFIRNESGKLRTASWDESAQLIAKKWNHLKSAGSESVCAIGSEHLPIEDNYLLSKLIRAAGFHLTGTLTHIESLIRSRNQNSFFDANLTSKQELSVIDGSDFILSFGNPHEETPVVANLIRRRLEKPKSNFVVFSTQDKVFKPDPHIRAGYNGDGQKNLILAVAKLLSETDSAKELPESLRSELSSESLAETLNINIEQLRSVASHLKTAEHPLLLLGSDIYRAADSFELHNMLSDFSKYADASLFVLYPYANTNGLLSTGFTNSKEILASIRAKTMHSVFLLAPESYLASEPKVSSELLDTLSQTEFLIVQSATHNAFTEIADLVLPDVPNSERTGVFINIEGRLQKTEHAVRGSAVPAWMSMSILAEKLSLHFDYGSPSEIFLEMAESFSFLKEFDYNSVQTSDHFTLGKKEAAL